MAHVLAVLLLVSSAQAAAGSNDWNENEAALARDPEPPAPPPPPPAPPPPTPGEKLRAASLVYDLELRSGIGWGSLSQFVPVYDEDALFGVSGEDYKLADLTLGSVDLSLGLGTFLSKHWKIGYEATGGLRPVVSTRNTLQVSRTVESDEQPSVPSREALQQTALYVLPVGGYLALYPAQSAGFSIGLHLGGGLFWGADYMGHGSLPTVAALAADIGYDDAWSDHLAWGVRAGCGWKAFHLSDTHTDESWSLGATELSLALHLSAF